MRKLPREVDPTVYNMLQEDPGDIKYADVSFVVLVQTEDMSTNE